jgi:rSAM/selenodomain-associated transferase 1
VTGPRRALVVIAKEPVPGVAKTRLAPILGADGAARVAAAMLADTVAVMRRVDAEPWVCFAPPDARLRMARLASGCGLLAQAEGDLGDRLAACFAALLGRGADQVVVVAADTPQVSRTTCEEAFALLDRVDVVLGPAEDGGYYLVGAKAALPELFVGVPMGTDVVLQVTIRRALRRRLRIATVPMLCDLDRLEDLQATLAAGELDGSPRTRLVVADLLADRPAPTPPAASSPGQPSAPCKRAGPVQPTRNP